MTDKKNSRFMSFFISSKLREDPVAYDKAKIIVGVSLFLLLGGFGDTIRAFTFNHTIIGIVNILYLLTIIVSLWILKKIGSRLVAGNSILTAYFITQMMIIFKSGGINVSPYTYNLMIIVLIGYIICGFRSGVFWSVASVVSIIILNYMKNNGVEFPPELGHDETAFFLTPLIVSIILAVLGGAYERISTGNMEKFAKEKEVTEKAGQELKEALDETGQVMNAAAEGDLTHKIEGAHKGELERLKAVVNGTLAMLQDTVRKVVVTSQDITNGSGELAAASQNLASGATEQAASLEEVSSSMDEIGHQAKVNKDNATEALNLTSTVVETIQSGKEQMNGLLKTMDAINESSAGVNRVVKVIDEIAFQTNLLALNAAVEAARAGAYGKGFAVVADEVRNLAGRCAEAVKETTELVDSAVGEVKNGMSAAGNTAEILDEFVTRVENLNDLIREISTASEEQNYKISEINTGLEQVNAVVQQNSSLSEETASASQELSSAATDLKGQMEKFRINGGAGGPSQGVDQKAYQQPLLNHI